MHKRLLVVISLLLCMHGYAQQADDEPTQKELKKKVRSVKPEKPPVCYIGFSGGINNPAGIVGFDFNIKVANYVTFDGGAGPSTWGNKLYVGAKYYIKPVQRGFALGGGITFNSGQENARIKMETVNGRQDVKVNLKAQTNAFIAVYHYWNIGRKYNRFFAEVGKSVQLHGAHYHEVYGPPLTDKSADNIRSIAPGGLMAGVGFSFALYRI